MSVVNDSGYLKVSRNELMKQYLEYDGSDRLVTVYEARAAALDGEKCLKTTYTYDGVSTRVEKLKEELALWDEDFDI